jgi:hypothetical protein
MSEWNSRHTEGKTERQELPFKKFQLRLVEEEGGHYFRIDMDPKLDVDSVQVNQQYNFLICAIDEMSKTFVAVTEEVTS